MRLREMLLGVGLGLGLLACAAEVLAQQPPEPLRLPVATPKPTPPPKGLEPVAEPTVQAMLAARGNLARWRDAERARRGPTRKLPEVVGFFAFFSEASGETSVRIGAGVWEDAASQAGAPSVLSLEPPDDCGRVEVDIADVAYLGGMEQRPVYKPLAHSLRPAAAGPPVLGPVDVLWLKLVTPRLLISSYPASAIEASRSGKVALRCKITAGPLDCKVAQEEPRGWGFGRAGLQVATQIAVAPQLPDGSSAIGRELCVPIRYQTR
jgi:hypothetical protein